MAPLTHLLASWSVADLFRLRRRDQALVTWCGVLPDADGLGLIIDAVNRLLDRSGTWYYYGVYHHYLLHGLFAAVVIPLAMCLLAASRGRVFVVGFRYHPAILTCNVISSD